MSIEIQNKSVVVSILFILSRFCFFLVDFFFFALFFFFFLAFGVQWSIMILNLFLWKSFYAQFPNSLSQFLEFNWIWRNIYFSLHFFSQQVCTSFFVYTINDRILEFNNFRWPPGNTFFDYSQQYAQPNMTRQLLDLQVEVFSYIVTWN